MALVRVVNRTQNRLSVPAPISRVLGPNAAATVRVNAADLAEDAALASLVKRNLIEVTVTEDPNTPDVLEQVTSMQKALGDVVVESFQTEYQNSDAHQVAIHLDLGQTALVDVRAVARRDIAGVITKGAHLVRASLQRDLDGDYADAHSESVYSQGGIGVVTVAVSGSSAYVLCTGTGTDPLAATGSVETEAGADIVDGEVVVISDGTTAVTFEFDDDASVVETPTLRAVAFTAGDADTVVAASLAAAITGTPDFGVAVEDVVGNAVNLVNTTVGVDGNVAITTDSDAVVTGMAGGVDAATETVDWVCSAMVLKSPPTSV